MKGNYVQRGESINYINPTDATISAGDIVVLGKRVGIAGCDIRPGMLGSLHTVGVYLIPKANIATHFTVGAEVYYSEAGAIDSGDVKIGWTVEPSLPNYDAVMVQIS